VTAAHDPIHPGEILLEEFLTPMGITEYRPAETISVPTRRVDEILHGERAISPDTALRLSRALGTSDRFRMNLHSRYDLDVAISKHREELDQIEPLISA
jgi:antitoxin HigA-1